jgi:hypothetical protein
MFRTSGRAAASTSAPSSSKPKRAANRTARSTRSGSAHDNTAACTSDGRSHFYLSRVPNEKRKGQLRLPTAECESQKAVSVMHGP